MLNLDRAASSLTADISDPLSAIASSQENIAQTRQQIHQLTNDCAFHKNGTFIPLIRGQLFQ